MTQELIFEDVLFEDEFNYITGDLVIVVKPLFEENSLDPYGAFPTEGYSVQDFELLSGHIYYIHDTTELDAEVELDLRQVLAVVNAYTIIEKLQELDEEA